MKIALNFSAQDKKKIGLGLMMLGGLIYAFFTFAIGPLTAQRILAEKGTKELAPKIKLAKDQIARTKALEEKSVEDKLVIDQIGAMISPGAPLAWFPPRIEDLAKRSKIEKINVTMGAETQEKSEKKYKRIAWNLGLLKVGFIPLCTLIKDIENEELLVEVQSVSIEEGEQDTLKAALTISSLLR